jgi:hypothetical protein
MKNSRQPVAVEAREERAASLLDRNTRPLENVEDLLMRTRVDLAELKRTGAREGLPELLADVTELKSEIEQLEAPPGREAGQPLEAPPLHFCLRPQYFGHRPRGANFGAGNRSTALRSLSASPKASERAVRGFKSILVYQ